jgi:hypothetical protein
MKNNLLRKSFFVSFFLAMTFVSAPCFSGNAKHPDDSHYTDIGFFDIHVCNWPDRPPFYMALYSTKQYNNVESVEIISPSDNVIGQLNLNKYRVIKKNNKVIKHVFITKIPVPEMDEDGWFKARVKLKDGGSDSSSDYVIHQLLPRAKGMQPGYDAEDVALPKQLSWDKIDGAAYYKVFIRDLWAGEKLIYKSKLLDKNTMTLPKNLLHAGGYYSWRVHARDVNEHIQLGDFNIGSLNEWTNFSVKEPLINSE